MTDMREAVAIALHRQCGGEKWADCDEWSRRMWRAQAVIAIGAVKREVDAVMQVFAKKAKDAGYIPFETYRFLSMASGEIDQMFKDALK